MKILFSGADIDSHRGFEFEINQMIASPNAVNSPVLLVYRAAPRKNGELESVITGPNESIREDSAAGVPLFVSTVASIVYRIHCDPPASNAIQSVNGMHAA